MKRYTAEDSIRNGMEKGIEDIIIGIMIPILFTIFKLLKESIPLPQNQSGMNLDGIRRT